MESFGLVVLIIFIVIRVVIAAGLVYLIVYEVCRLKKQYGRRSDEEVRKDVDAKTDGKHIDSSSSSRS